MRNCELCNKETSNPKFCSRSCAATVNNMNRPKRKPEGRCSVCGCAVSTRNKYCRKCYDAKFFVDWDSLTLGEIRGARDYQKNSVIRTIVRNRYLKEGKLTRCQNCGYDKHVEVCHIKPVHTFLPTATLADVNASSNIAILCRNCHWELDHGMLTL